MVNKYVAELYRHILTKTIGYSIMLYEYDGVWPMYAQSTDYINWLIKKIREG